MRTPAPNRGPGSQHLWNPRLELTEEVWGFGVSGEQSREIREKKEGSKERKGGKKSSFGSLPCNLTLLLHVLYPWAKSPHRICRSWWKQEICEEASRGGRNVLEDKSILCKPRDDVWWGTSWDKQDTKWSSKQSIADLHKWGPQRLWSWQLPPLLPQRGLWDNDLDV